MISNQILQSTIDGLKGITRVDLCIIDTEGKVLATTFPDADKYIGPAAAFVESPADSQVVQGCQFFKVFDEHQLEYILLANGDSDDVFMIGKIASFQVQNLLVAYKERFDKDNFIKNLLLDNLLLVDIYNRAKKLHIDTEVRRVVFIIETNREKDGNELEKVRSLFGGKSKDFVTEVDEKNIILVKELADNESYDDLKKTADVILSLFPTDANHSIHIAYGTIVNEIKEVLVQLYAYCGFPRSLNALNNFMALVMEREARGLKDVPGRLPGPKRCRHRSKQPTAAACTRTFCAALP